MSQDSVREVKVALIGAGSVGRIFLEVIIKKRTLLREKHGLVFKIVLVVDSSGNFDMKN